MVSKFILKLYKDENFSEYYEIYNSNHNDKKIWLQNQDGEGGDFSVSKLYDIIDKFFKENF